MIIVTRFQRKTIKIDILCSFNFYFLFFNGVEIDAFVNLGAKTLFSAGVFFSLGETNVKMFVLNIITVT